tara:strand:- start:3247 stop:4293 length:1047 start_codon:yes stop_codon:yes gene_type:complete
MIKSNYTQSIDKFIESALYSKSFGYYSNNNPFGKKGDFITAPLISPLFSEMISVWVISFWIEIGKPKKFSFVELGPGNGALCKTFCRIVKKFPEFEKSVKIFLLEKSDKLIKIQKNTIQDKKVSWIKNLNVIKDGPVLFFGNEFFDSIPIKQFKAQNFKIYEKFIKLNNGKFEKFIFKRTTKKIINNLKNLNLLKKDGIIEYPQNGLNILDSLTKKVLKLGGGILLIDYGYMKSEGKSTLQSLKSQKKNIFYKNIGKADITYLVNFQLLKRFFQSKKLFLNDVVSQSFFLKRLGIIERAELLSRKMNFREKSDLYYRIERLLSEKKMGKLFKVIFVSSKKIKFNLGFK